MSEISVYQDDNINFSKEVKKAKSGDTEAFSKLYALVYKEMYRTALLSLRNSYDASDAVSETVIDAFQSIKNLKNEYAFKKWIMKILTCKIKNKQKEYINNLCVEYEDTYMRSTEFNFEYHELKTVIDELDDESKMILSMSVVNRFTSNEISEICKIKASTVRSKLHRIKEKLKLSLEYDV